MVTVVDPRVPFMPDVVTGRSKEASLASGVGMLVRALERVPVASDTAGVSGPTTPYGGSPVVPAAEGDGSAAEGDGSVAASPWQSDVVGVGILPALACVGALMIVGVEAALGICVSAGAVCNEADAVTAETVDAITLVALTVIALVWPDVAVIIVAVAGIAGASINVPCAKADGPGTDGVTKRGDPGRDAGAGVIS